MSRIPAWCRYVTQEKDNPVYDGVYWESPQYQWKNKKPAKPDRLRIYEAHGKLRSARKVFTFVDRIRRLVTDDLF